MEGRKEQRRGTKRGGKKLGFAPGFVRATTEEQARAILAATSAVEPCPVHPCHVCRKERSGASKVEGLTLHHLTPGEDFEYIPDPIHIDDWLHQYVEPRQSFSQWYSSQARNRVTDERRTIYFLPFGEFEDNACHIFDKLQAFARIYFIGMEVKLLSTLGIEAQSGKLSIEVPRVTRSRRYTVRVNIPWRVAHPYDLHKVKDKQTMRQLHAPPILTSLQHFLPDDAYCLLAFTMEDLYDGQRDSFVVGLASLESRVGLFSFARYDPLFKLKFASEDEPHDEDARRTKRARSSKRSKRKGKEAEPEQESEAKGAEEEPSVDMEANRRMLIARSCKVMAHEVFHMFNVEHCVYYSCCMNGSGHVEEDDSQPLHLCPIDLHKLYHALGGFNVEERYRLLHEFYTAEGMKRESEWIEARLNFLAARRDSPEDDDQAPHEQHAEAECEQSATQSSSVRRSRRIQHLGDRQGMMARLQRG